MDGISYAECSISQYKNFAELFPENKERGEERKENGRKNDEKGRKKEKETEKDKQNIL
jgi:hypothetical protein